MARTPSRAYFKHTERRTLMARVRSQLPILPSLLDRLIDDDPQSPQDVEKSAPTLLQEIKSNIRRDLENLLNTRLFRAPAPGLYPELERSVINYGLPDFSTVQFGSAEHLEQFRRVVQETIEKFETRFRQVRVDIMDAGEDYDRTLYLKINSVLMVEPDPVPVLFDSRIHALDRVMKLRELRNG